MSYSRFGCEDSSVYVILTSRGLECCGCPAGEVRTVFLTTAELLDHLDGHRRIGHTVPDSCYRQLREDAEENDADILLENP